MLAKCANAACSAPFLYLREGKLYQVELDAATAPISLPEKHPGTDEVQDFSTDRKPSRHLEFFWLCGACSSNFTLAFQRGRGIVAVPIRPTEKVAVAA